MAAERYERLEVTSATALGSWLAKHGATSPGVWLVLAKKRPGAAYVPRAEIVAQAIAHGWIDSLPRTLDAERSMLLLTPRKPTSNWSKVNREIAERLIAEGKMSSAGLTAVRTAKRTGRWQALDAVEALVEPAELAAALDADPAARSYWDAFPRSARRAILEWIGAAKRPDTRTARIQETARLAAENIRANQWRQPKNR